LISISLALSVSVSCRWPEDLLAPDGDQNPPALEVGIELRRRVLGELEERSELRARADVLLDADRGCRRRRLEALAEELQPLGRQEPEPAVRLQAERVVHEDVRSELGEPRLSRPRFGPVDQRPADPLPAQARRDVPPLDVGHRRADAALGPGPQREGDEPAEGPVLRLPDEDRLVEVAAVIAPEGALPLGHLGSIRGFDRTHAHRRNSASRVARAGLNGGGGIRPLETLNDV
jgi:hypothetical protein